MIFLADLIFYPNTVTTPVVIQCPAVLVVVINTYHYYVLRRVWCYTGTCRVVVTSATPIYQYSRSTTTLCRACAV